MSARTTIIEALAQAEELAFTNAKAEREFRHEFDKFIRAAVRPHEQNLVRRAEAHMEKFRELVPRADEIASALSELRAAIRKGDLPPVEALEQLKHHEAQARQLMQFAESLPDRTASLLTKLEDPVTDLDAIQQRYSALRRTYLGGVNK